jgi:hypothetical protein
VKDFYNESYKSLKEAIKEETSEDGRIFYTHG